MADYFNSSLGTAFGLAQALQDAEDQAYASNPFISTGRSILESPTVYDPSLRGYNPWATMGAAFTKGLLGGGLASYGKNQVSQQLAPLQNAISSGSGNMSELADVLSQNPTTQKLGSTLKMAQNMAAEQQRAAQEAEAQDFARKLQFEQAKMQMQLDMKPKIAAAIQAIKDRSGGGLSDKEKLNIRDEASNELNRMNALRRAQGQPLLDVEAELPRLIRQKAANRMNAMAQINDALSGRSRELAPTVPAPEKEETKPKGLLGELLEGFQNLGKPKKEASKVQPQGLFEYFGDESFPVDVRKLATKEIKSIVEAQDRRPALNNVINNAIAARNKMREEGGKYMSILPEAILDVVSDAKRAKNAYESTIALLVQEALKGVPSDRDVRMTVTANILSTLDSSDADEAKRSALLRNLGGSKEGYGTLKSYGFIEVDDNGLPWLKGHMPKAPRQSDRAEKIQRIMALQGGR